MDTYLTKQTTKQAARSWASEQLWSLFAPSFSPEVIKEAESMLQHRRLLDYLIQAGKVSSRIHDFDATPHRIEISIQKLSEAVWNQIFTQLASQAYFLAMLLAGRLPAEINDIFSTCECELLPSSLDEVIIVFDNHRQSAPLPFVAAVILRLCDFLDNDPFVAFTLRGCGREETLTQIQRRRTALRKPDQQQNILSPREINYRPAPPLISTLDHFWSAGKELWDISYNIRADELPASILRWLGPPPLHGLEEYIEENIDTVYEKVSRLGQAYGLGFHK